MPKSNLAPIIFENDNYKLYRTAWIDGEHYQSIKKVNRKGNTIFRNGEFIYCSHFSGANPLQGAEIVELNINRDIHVTSQLVHNLIFRRLMRQTLLLTDFNPIKFHLNKAKYNLLRKHVPSNLTNKISFWKGYKIDTRITRQNGNVFYHALFNSFNEWKIKISCKEALQHISESEIIGRYVTVYLEDHVLVGGKRLAGFISKVRGEEIEVDSKGELLKYNSNEIYLENSYENRALILTSFLGQDKAEEILKFVFDSAGKRNSSAKLEEDAKYIESVLCGKKVFFQNTTGLRFKLLPLIDAGSDNLRKITTNKPTYVFNLHGTQKDIWHDRGLREYGPYSKNRLLIADNQPLIVVIGRKSSQGDLTRFMAKFKNGLPNIRTNRQNPYEPYGQGFVRKYHLAGLLIKFYYVENESISEYSRVITRALEENDDIDLAVVESQEKYKDLPDDRNPYYLTKARFLARGISSQEILYRNIILNDHSTAFLLNNMSLAVYAKMGGKPWVIPKESSIEHEIIIGIGNKVFKKNRFDYEGRVVGITTFFTSSGDYLMSNMSKDVAYEDYISELKRSLKIDLNRIKKKENWLDGDTIRLVFHVFKPFTDDEINIVEDIVNKFSDSYNILFAYVTFSEFNPYKLFDPNQAGVKAGRDKYKGKGVPSRGLAYKVGDNQSIIQLVGPRELKSTIQGMPSPLLIKIHEKSTFDSLEYITRQAFIFASISWRGFLPSSTPVTLEYSSLVTKHLGNLRRSGFLADSILDSKLRDKAWFL